MGDDVTLVMTSLEGIPLDGAHYLPLRPQSSLPQGEMWPQHLSHQVPFP